MASPMLTVGVSACHKQVNPPTKQKEGHCDQRNDHDIFNQGMKVIASAAGADLIHTESYVNEKHKDHGHPVIKLSKYCGQRI